MSAIGLELGATWIRGVALHPDGSVGERISEPTQESPSQTVQLLWSLWHRLGSSQMVGLALAPELDATGNVCSWPNRPEHIGINLLAPFLQEGLSPLVLDDATAASVAEHLSATEGDCLPSSTSYISVGTGIGAGVVFHDRVWAGANGKAMDLGHVPVPAATGTQCTCGGRGCLQTVASGRHLENRAQELRLSAKKILELAANGDEQALQLLTSIAVPLVQGIQTVERLINPDRIILGGGLMSAEIFFESVVRKATESGCSTPILKSRWGTWAGALGVALEVFRHAGLATKRLTDKPERISYRCALIQGPNLNLLGEREPEHYGNSTLKEIEDRMSRLADEMGCHLYCVQSNHESELVEWIQHRLDRLDGVIINPAALTAHGYALRDALTAKRTPFIEVHLSNTYKREDLHQESCFAAIALGRIVGLGAEGYELALRSLVQHVSHGAN